MVIPTHGRHRRDLLARCLAALAATDGADVLEVIVVVDGGDEGDGAGLAPPDLRCRFLAQPRSGPAAARNRGWRATDAPVVAFVDDDTVVGRRWLADLAAAFAAAPDLAGVGGAVLPLRPRNLVSRAVTDLGHIAHHRASDGWRLVTANAAFRRDALEAVGGFDETFAQASGEDWDLSVRLQRAGFRLDAIAGAEVRHEHPTTVRAMMATARRYHASVPLLEARGSRSVAPVEAHPPEALTPSRRFVGWAKGRRRRGIEAARQRAGRGRVAGVVAGVELVLYGGPFLRKVPTFVARARRAPARPSWPVAVLEALLEVAWRAEFARPVRSPAAAGGALRISVVVPSSGRPELARAVESVLGQTYPHWECIVVDDRPHGEGLALPADPRLRTVGHHGRRSPGASRNTGAEAATGDVLVFLDDDDELLPNRLQDVARALPADGLHVCAMRRTYPDGTERSSPLPLPGRLGPVLRGRPPFVTQVAIWRRDFVPFEPALRYAEDVEWWFRVAPGASLAVTDRPGYHKHERVPEERPSAAARRFEDRRRILELHDAALRGDRRALAFHRARAASAALLADRYAEARSLAAGSLVALPSVLAAKVWWRAATRRPRR